MAVRVNARFNASVINAAPHTPSNSCYHVALDGNLGIATGNRGRARQVCLKHGSHINRLKIKQMYQWQRKPAAAFEYLLITLHTNASAHFGIQCGNIHIWLIENILVLISFDCIAACSHLSDTISNDNRSINDLRD